MSKLINVKVFQQIHMNVNKTNSGMELLALNAKSLENLPMIFVSALKTSSIVGRVKSVENMKLERLQTLPLKNGLTGS